MNDNVKKPTIKKIITSSKTKQKAFKRSRRFYRGRIMRLLTERKKVSLTTIDKLLFDCPFSSIELLNALESENMLTREGKTISL